MSKELAKDKGEFGGSCNFTSCQKPNSATWFNHFTKLYYCPECAKRCNNDPHLIADGKVWFGHLPYTEGKHEPE